MKTYISTGHILEKLFVRHRGYIFSTVLLNDGQNLCLDIPNKFTKKGHVVSKTKFTKSNHTRTLACNQGFVV